MSIDKLNEMKSEVQGMRVAQERSAKAAKNLAILRNSDRPLWDQIDVVLSRWHSGSDREARDAVASVINELAVDIYRLAELRLQARAREMQIKAAQREAVLHACILPVPGNAEPHPDF